MSHTEIGDGNCQIQQNKSPPLGLVYFGPILVLISNENQRINGESQELCQKLLGSAEAQKLSGSDGGSTEVVKGSSDGQGGSKNQSVINRVKLTPLISTYYKGYTPVIHL